MDRQSVCIYGAGGHARVVADAIESTGRTIGAYLDEDREMVETSGGRCLPGIELAGPEFVAPDLPIILSFGNNRVRQKLDQKLTVSFTTAVHASAVVSGKAEIGIGTAVFANAVLQPNARVGRHAIINTKASVDHDCVIEDFAHIAPGATLCGNVHVGEGSHIGAGATVIEGIRIGKWATVGAGAVVIRDVPDFSTVVGCPAAPVKSSG